MVGRVRAAYDRLGPWPAFAVFAGVGAAAWALALVSLAPLVRAIAAGAPLVVLAPHDAVGLPIGVSFLALAAITLSPAPIPHSHARSRSRQRPAAWPVACLWVAAAGVVLSFFAGSLAEVAVAAATAERGYAACPPIAGERPAKWRWVRSDGQGTSRCPSSQAT